MNTKKPHDPTVPFSAEELWDALNELQPDGHTRSDNRRRGFIEFVSVKSLRGAMFLAAVRSMRLRAEYPK